MIILFVLAIVLLYLASVAAGFALGRRHRPAAPKDIQVWKHIQGQLADARAEIKRLKG